MSRAAGAACVAGSASGGSSSRMPTTPSSSGCIWETATSASSREPSGFASFWTARYRTIVDETDALLRRCFPQNPVGRVLVPRWRRGRPSRLLRAPRPASSRSTGPARSTTGRSCSKLAAGIVVDRSPVGVPARLHPLRRLRLRQPHRPLRVPELRLRELLVRHPRPLRGHLPRAGPASAPLRTGDPPQPPRGRRPPPRACGHEVLTVQPLRLAPRRLWRNWQTRGVQVAVSLRSWRFESSQPHWSRLLPWRPVRAAIV